MLVLIFLYPNSTMLFDRKKFVDSILALQGSCINPEDNFRYTWRQGSEIRKNFRPLFIECISWESVEEKTAVFDYMRQFGVQEQIERDFSASRQVVNGQVLFVPAYETWSAAEALLMLMTYRNSPKLVQATVQEHRNFIKGVAGDLLPQEPIAWVYKASDEYERALDRGYSYMTFPVIAQGATYFEYLWKLQCQQECQKNEQERLDKTLKQVADLTGLVTSSLAQLQAV